MVAEPYFFRNEFLYYFRELPLSRVPRGHSCVAAPPGMRYAYFAIDRRPQCWRQLPGERGRSHNIYWVLMPPVEDR